MISLLRDGARLRALTFGLVFVVVMFGALVGVGLFAAMDAAHAKTPGSTYCFYGKCHRVKTIAETQRLVGKTISFYSSHYDSCHKDRYNPCGLTSSGEPFFAHRADNAASPIYPDGTKLLVWSPTSKQAAVVRINNAGPYWGNRKLDVSRALARKLGFEKRGVAKLQTRVLSAPTRQEARYKRNRRYDKVKGPIGKFASLDEAERGLAVLLAFDAMTTATLAPSLGGAVARVNKPFEVAARVTQGRAFAYVRSELKTWPIVGERAVQVAGLRWPVVEALQIRVAKTKRPVQRIARLKSWPVVDDPNAPPVLRRENRKIAMAWPVVYVASKLDSMARADTKASSRDTLHVALALPGVGPGNKAKQRLSQTTKAKRRHKAKKLRAVAKTRSAKKRKAQRRMAQKSSKKATKRWAKANARRKTKSSKVKVAKVGKRPKPRTGKPTTAVKSKQRPYVAVRQILHRNLGRGA